jgi:hypothetical protein
VVAISFVKLLKLGILVSLPLPSTHQKASISAWVLKVYCVPEAVVSLPGLNLTVNEMSFDAGLIAAFEVSVIAE